MQRGVNFYRATLTSSCKPRVSDSSSIRIKVRGYESVFLKIDIAAECRWKCAPRDLIMRAQRSDNTLLAYHYRGILRDVSITATKNIFIKRIEILLEASTERFSLSSRKIKAINNGKRRKQYFTCYFAYVKPISPFLPRWNSSSVRAAYSSKKRVGTCSDRYHLKRGAIGIAISERIGTRVVIEYGLSAQKMEIIARTAYRVIAMHRSQYGSSLAAFDFLLSLQKGVARQKWRVQDQRNRRYDYAGLATD